MDKKNTAVVKVVKKRGKDTVRYFSDRTLKGAKSKFITDSLNNKHTAYVDILPREYDTNKMSREADLPGGYDLRKAKELLGLRLNWYDADRFNYQSK